MKKLIAILLISITIFACKSPESKLLKAIMENDNPQVHALIADGIDVNYLYPLSKAPVEDSRFIYEIIAKRTNLPKMDAHKLIGFTPIILASLVSNDEAFHLLLSEGADLEFSVSENAEFQVTALAIMLYIGFGLEGTNYLLDAKSKIQLNLPGNLSTLMLVAQINHPFKSDSSYTTETVKRLLDAGANPHQIAHDGSTALHFAVDNEQIESSKLLLQAGVNPNIRNNESQTALTIARTSDNQEIIDLLIQHGATE